MAENVTINCQQCLQPEQGFLKSSAAKENIGLPYVPLRTSVRTHGVHHQASSIKTAAIAAIEKLRLS